MPSGIFERLTGMFFLGFSYFWRFARQAQMHYSLFSVLNAVMLREEKEWFGGEE